MLKDLASSFLTAKSAKEESNGFQANGTRRVASKDGS
jgi:hypothetical protein